MKYVYFAHPEQPDALALWIVYTHWFPQNPPFSFVPYTLVTSAEKQSGKSTVLEIAGMLVHAKLIGQSVTAALIGRTCGGRTLLLDEIDGVYSARRAANDPGATDLRTILNSGFKYDGKYDRLDTKTFKPLSFSTFGPKMLVGSADAVPETVADRSIAIRLERKPHGLTLPKFREQHERQATAALREKLAELAGTIVLGEVEVEAFPDKLDGRREDIWEPLYALARAAGPRWYAKAVRASSELTKMEPSVSLGVRPA